jgi:hypothetical protein
VRYSLSHRFRNSRINVYYIGLKTVTASSQGTTTVTSTDSTNMAQYSWAATKNDMDSQASLGDTVTLDSIESLQR